MYYGGCNDTGCFGIKLRTDAAKVTNVRIARFRECRDLTVKIGYPIPIWFDILVHVRNASTMHEFTVSAVLQ